MTEAPGTEAPGAGAPGTSAEAVSGEEGSGASLEAALDQRYGRARQRGIDRRLGWGIAGVAVLTGLALVVFGGWQTPSSLEFRELHYDVVDSRTVRVDFEVTAPAGEPVACALEALSPSYATVGWEVLELPISEQRTRRFTETLVTSYEATTGRLRTCWVIDGPA